MNMVDQKIEDYCVKHSTIPSEICQEIEAYTWKNVYLPQMVAGPLVASFLGFMIRALKASHILELGTFTGHTSLAMAENTDGTVTTIDIKDQVINIAKPFWEKSPHGTKIKSYIGPALSIIPTIPGQFDFIFIDADKNNYLNYFEMCFPRLSPQGVMIFDNCLWSGKVLEENGDAMTLSLKKLNDYLAQRNDLYVTLLPVRDGLMCVTKRQTISAASLAKI